MASSLPSVQAWVSDELHTLLGFSDGATASYIVALARDAASAQALVTRLAADGVDVGESGLRFAEGVLARVREDGGAERERKRSMRAKKEREGEVVRKMKAVEEASGYEMLDEGAGTVKSGGVEGKEERRRRKREKRERREREEKEKKGRVEEEEKFARERGGGGGVDQDANRVGVRAVKKRRRVRDSTGEIGSDEEREGKNEDDDDIRERDAFAERLRKRDRGEVSGEDHEESTVPATVEPPDDTTIERLRDLSRRTYLKKRETQELEKLRQEIDDEKELFKNEDLTLREKRDMALKEELYRLASTRVKELRENEMNEEGGKREARYRMPDAYGDALDKKTDKEKRMELLSARFEDEHEGGKRGAEERKRPLTDQGRWEEAQIRKAAAGSGGHSREHGSKAYDFVMEPISFVEHEGIPDSGGRRHCQQAPNSEPFVSAAEQHAASMKKQRRSLPMFQYREALVDAVKKYQVLVVVSETGSGKTTQIPQYLIEEGFGKVACTQPRRVAAMSVAARVADEMGVKLGSEVGYSIRFEDCTSDKTVIKYMTDGMLLREFLSEPNLAGYNVIIVDEAHERSLGTDIVMGLIKDIARFRKDDIRIIISSATLNAEKFSVYFDDAPVFKVPGRMYHVDMLYAAAPLADHVEASVTTVLQIHASQPLGDILVFLTGQDEIETAAEALQVRTRGLGTRLGELIVAPIYATLPSDLQAKIFEPTPPGARKVVLATNIAETSVTIPGIVYVIDPGYCKQKGYNPKTGMESLLVVAVSQAGAIQRAGRAGRTQAGKCFRLYTKWSYHHEMEKDTTPEILRTNLAQVVLQLMSLGIDNLLEFDFLDAPPVEVLSRSLEQLYALGALSDRGLLTKLGRRMAELPLDPMMAKALLASEKYRCSDEVATICSMLSVNNAVFYRPKEKKLLSDAAHAAFARGGGGDHIRLLNCYVQWRDSGYSEQWCYENFVQARTIKRARDVREQLEGLLERVELEIVSAGPGNFEPVLKALTAGFFYNGCKLQKNGHYRTLKNPHTVQIHPSSSLSKTERPPRWLIYHELVKTSKEFMRQVFELDPKWLTEVAGHYYKEKDIHDEGATNRGKKLPVPLK